MANSADQLHLQKHHPPIGSKSSSLTSRAADAAVFKEPTGAAETIGVAETIGAALMIGAKVTIGAEDTIGVEDTIGAEEEDGAVGCL